MMQGDEKAAMPPKVGRRKLYDSTLLVRLTAETLARIDAVRAVDGDKREERSAVIREALEREIERRQRADLKPKRGRKARE